MKRIPLTQGKEALVDDQDYEYLMQWKWYYDGGYAKRSTYPYGRKHNVKVCMHNVISQRMEFTGEQVDHRDRNGLNNQRRNLRPASVTQQAANRRIPRNNTSGYRGVYWHRASCKWRAQIKADKHWEHLGLFSTAVEAAKAYNKRAVELHGEFAHLNEV